MGQCFGKAVPAEVAVEAAEAGAVRDWLETEVSDAQDNSSTEAPRLELLCETDTSDVIAMESELGSITEAGDEGKESAPGPGSEAVANGMSHLGAVKLIKIRIIDAESLITDGFPNTEAEGVEAGGALLEAEVVPAAAEVVQDKTEEAKK